MKLVSVLTLKSPYMQASMSATSKFRRERSRELNKLETHETKVKSFPSNVSIPIVVEEEIDPGDAESTRKKETKIPKKDKDKVQIQPYATILAIGGVAIGFSTSFF